MGYIVKSPVVQARTVDGTFVHVYEGGALPDDVDQAQLAQLVEAGMVAEGDGEEKPKRRRASTSDDE